MSSQSINWTDQLPVQESSRLREGHRPRLSSKICRLISRVALYHNCMKAPAPCIV